MLNLKIFSKSIKKSENEFSLSNKLKIISKDRAINFWLDFTKNGADEFIASNPEKS